MAEIKIKTAKRVVPMIYAYTTPEIARHNGWTKIGYTEQAVEKRLKQQAHTDSNKATKEELLQYLTEEEYSDKILEIFNSYKTRVAINNGLSKEFRDSQKSSAIYKKLKGLLKEKQKS